MPKINQLAPHVADLIAAGEVVERPGSVVKELLENAIDAGARHITVEMQNGGMTFLRLTDDGCGMEPEDAKLAFLRHATSKLHRPEDLAQIQTLGFRGEALAAISAVSNIDLLTRTPGSTAGTSVHLDAGKITAFSEAGCPEGTTIIVRDLFYNTPARMKFMKSDTAEAANITSVVQKQALSHPELSIQLLKDGQEVLHTAGDGQLRSVVYSIWGRELANGMVDLSSSWESMRLSGLVTRPNVTRGNRSYQTFFVNGRYIRSKLLSAALEDAYQNQIMVGRMPACVLHLNLPCTMVDVNVHPAKTEIRFLSERTVYDCVRFGVLSALGRASGRVQMQLPDQPGANKAAPATPKTGSAGTARSAANPDAFRTMDAAQYKEFAATLEQAPRTKIDPAVLQQLRRSNGTLPVHSPSAAPVRPVASGGEKRTPPSKPAESVPKPPRTDAAPEPEPVQQSLPMPPVPDYRVIGEALDTYIIVEQDESILFIDKHAAHERILFEQLKQNPVQSMGQRLLAPLTYTPDREEAVLLLENQALLERLGYEIAEFGPDALAIRQIPAEIDQGDAVDCLNELAETLRNSRTTDNLHDALLHTIACKAAIKAGWHTQARERDALVREVLGREDLKYCPHGRPICISLTRRQLERQFKRS